MNKLVKMITAVLFTASVAACNPSVEQKNVEEVILEQPASTLKDYRVGDKLPNELVCMVNNAYMGKSQIPVKVMDKTYYGCCEMCKNTLAKEAGKRVAVDPVSGKEVDKAKAVIGAQEDGRVFYFESEENLNKVNALYSKK